MNGISILLVDDNDARAAKLIACLVAVSGIRSVDRSSSSSDARAKLVSNEYDILVLDVSLPKFPNSPAERDEGLHLLREMHETDLMHRPSHVIGITAYRELQLTSFSAFDRSFARLIYTESSESAWMSELEEFVAHVAVNQSATSSKVDVVVLTALWDPEFVSVLASGIGLEEGMPLDDATRLWLGSANGVSVAAACALRMGPVSAAILATKVIAALRPKMIVLAGICAGVRNEVNLGDVVVSTDVIIWDSGKLVDGGELSPAPVSYPVQERILSALRGHAVSDELAAYWGRAGSDRPAAASRIHFGPMASGSSVIADGNVVDHIRQHNRKVIAIDMEAFAVHAACAASSHPQPSVVTVKSVCDFADHLKESSVQRYASGASMTVVKAILNEAKKMIR